MFRYWLLLFFTFVSFIAHTQHVDSALYYCNYGNYEQAWKHLKAAVESKQALPDHAAFLHGKIMFHKGNYAESKAGFNKYLELTKGLGEYAAATKETLLLCEKQICIKCQNSGQITKEVVCTQCDESGFSVTHCGKCSRGKVLCTSCKGEKFEKEATPMGLLFKDCSKCNGVGIIDCPICAGTQKVKKICRNCQGTKKIKANFSCNH